MTITSPQRESTEEPSPRSPGTSVQEYLDNDARPVPAVLRYDINENLGTAPLDVERYISREFHDREVEKVWRKVWQFACREDHIPNPGDQSPTTSPTTSHRHASAGRQHQGPLQRVPAPRPGAAARAGESASCAARSTASPGTSTAR